MAGQPPPDPTSPTLPVTPAAASASVRRRPWLLLLLASSGALAAGLVAGALTIGRKTPPIIPYVELAEADLRRLAHDPQVVARGQLLWGNCVGCHGLQGQGALGPNLRDDYWLHGSDMRDLCRSIREGFPLKGMPAWGATGIPPEDIHALAAYVASLHGSDDGHGKAPEGVRQPITW